MFITDKEARERLSDSRNVLRVPPKEAEVEEVDELINEDEIDELINEEVSRALGMENQKGMENQRGSHISIGKGRTRGSKNEAHYANHIEDQKAIADVALIAGDRVARDLFGISPAQTHAYERGRQSSNPAQPLIDNGSLLDHVNKTKERIRSLAAQKLGAALNHLTDDKIEKTTRATDIGRLAKDLATVHDKMERKESLEAGVQFHVFVPEVKSITNYNVIRVSSEPKSKDDESI